MRLSTIKHSVLPLFLTIPRRIRLRPALIRLLPGPWTLVFLISVLLFWLLSTAVLAQHRYAPKPKSMTIQQVHQVIAPFSGELGRSLHGLIDVWYQQALHAGKSKPKAAEIALDKLANFLDRMYERVLDTTTNETIKPILYRQ